MPPRLQNTMDDIRFDSAGQLFAGPSYGSFQQDRGHLPAHPTVHERRRRLWLGDLATRFSTMISETGIKLPKSFKELGSFSFKDAAAQLAKGAARKLGAHVVRRMKGGKALVKGAVGATVEAAGAEGGPLGLMAGALVDEAFNAIVDRVLPEGTKGDVEWGDAKGKPLKHGDWVMIDNGELTEIATLRRENKQVGRFAGIFQDMGVSGANTELIREVDFTPGFVIGPSTQTPGFWQVFNFGRGDTKGVVEEKNPRAVHLVSGNLGEKWGQNEMLEVVKETYFARGQEKAYLEGGTVTDPGAIVIYNGVENAVIHARGDQLTIENGNNERRQVAVREVRPGKAPHNVSHNYGHDAFAKSVGDSYRTAGGEHLGRRFQGQWVWVVARPELTKRFHQERKPIGSELAVVHAVRGPMVAVFCAVDGAKRVVPQGLTLDAGPIVEMFGSSRRFQRFKDAAVTGYAVSASTLAPGRQGNVMDLLGRGPMRPGSTFETVGKKSTKPLPRGSDPRAGKLGASPAAQAHKRAQLDDMANEYSALTGARPATQLTVGNEAVLHPLDAKPDGKYREDAISPVVWMLGLGAIYLVMADGIGTALSTF